MIKIYTEDIVLSMSNETYYKEKFILESLSIKRTNHNTYNLYALVRHFHIVNNEPIEYLINIKSNDLKWDYTLNILTCFETIEIKGGYSDSRLISFLDRVTREVLHNIQLKNMHHNETIVEFTILNKGDELMEYNIYEDLEFYIVEVNVVGLTKKEISVVLEDEIIRVKTKPQKSNKNIDLETKLETFKPIKSETEIYLPNVEEVNAKLENGILILTVPKISKGVKINIE